MVKGYKINQFSRKRNQYPLCFLQTISVHYYHSVYHVAYSIVSPILVSTFNKGVENIASLFNHMSTFVP